MDETLEIRIGGALRARGLRLAAAESCTGGLVGHRVTNVPGSSTYYVGSVTAYAYEAKVRLLGVRWDTLEAYGAVSEEVAEEMATGVRKALGADVGLSISGIAGPGGGTEEKPVGMVCFALSHPEGVWTSTQYFDGNRLAVKEQSADFILRSLLAYLEGTLA